MAEDCAATSLDGARRLGDKLLMADGLALRSDCLRRRDELAGARADMTAAIAIFRQIGDRWTLNLSLANLAVLELHEQDVPSARAHLEEAHRSAIEMNSPVILQMILGNLGNAALVAGDVTAAKRYYREQMTDGRRTGDLMEVGYALLGLGLCASAERRHALAAKLHGASDALVSSLGQALDPLEGGMQDRDLATLRTAMGAAFEPAYAVGSQIDFETAIALAGSDGSETPRTFHPDPGDRADRRSAPFPDESKHVGAASQTAN